MLFILNSMVGVSDSELITSEQKIEYVQEAINLGQSYKHLDIKDDFHMVEIN